MNANELANKLKEGLELGINSNLYILDAATMLCQLQSENEALKGELINLKIDVGHEVEKFEKLMEDFKIEWMVQEK